MELYDFIVTQWRGLESGCEHRMRPVRVLLQQRREWLLEFASDLDERIANVAVKMDVQEKWVREMLFVQEMAMTSGRKWCRDEGLHRELRGRYHGVSVEVQKMRREVVRASSAVENVNGQLRRYFSARRQIKGKYLELLRFYLNHRVVRRSERKEREGRSPAEVLTGQKHGHWLEMLGYRRFKRSA